MTDMITMIPGLRSGQPTIRGTRLAVADVLGYLAAGMSEAELMSDFPELMAGDIQMCRDWQADQATKKISGPGTWNAFLPVSREAIRRGERKEVIAQVTEAFMHMTRHEMTWEAQRDLDIELIEVTIGEPQEFNMLVDGPPVGPLYARLVARIKRRP